MTAQNIHILTGGTAIQDYIMTLDKETYDQMKDFFNVSGGDKKGLEQYGNLSLENMLDANFHKAIQGKEYSLSTGGSSANTLYTVIKAMQASEAFRVSADYVSYFEDSQQGEQQLQEMQNLGINVIGGLKQGLDTAKSFVFVNETDGERFIITHAGNMADIIEENPFDYSKLQTDKTTHALLPLSLLRDSKFSENAKTLFNQFMQSDATLIASLPTRRETMEAHYDYIKEIIPNMHHLLSNDKEACMYHTKGKKKIGEVEIDALLNDAIGGMQRNQAINKMPQTIMVTQGKDGATSLFRDGMMAKALSVDAVPVASPKNSLGAGDASYAGYMLGIIAGITKGADLARLAMLFGAQKMEELGSRIEDPAMLWTDIKDIFSALFPGNGQGREK